MTILIPDPEQGVMYEVISSEAETLLIDSLYTDAVYILYKGKIIRYERGINPNAKCVIRGEFITARDFSLVAMKQPGCLYRRGLDLLRELGFIVKL